MPPPQCPECGRFLATAFVEQITTEPAPCPGCGTELSLGEDDAAVPEEPPAVPPPAAAAAGAGDVTMDVDGDAPISDVPVRPQGATSPAATDAPDGVEPEDDEETVAVPPPAAALPDDVEPEPETSVRPPDLAPERDPLDGWDEATQVGTVPDEPDPAVIAAGAGLGLVVGLLLGGRRHRGLGALLGAALGAALARLRG